GDGDLDEIDASREYGRRLRLRGDGDRGEGRGDRDREQHERPWPRTAASADGQKRMRHATRLAVKPADGSGSCFVVPTSSTAPPAPATTPPVVNQAVCRS